ncbi:class II D-tagatose-bisphosphate aldolase non-catalytic subunit [Arhodomonas sp. AD133]|uniref:class II D-tagatose-bisphosphate aldolase non-catalytic subunit n=1 Tax=Arhodomonas sp. AD133 TaxID=3415009 RepID=UPI003EBE1D26
MNDFKRLGELLGANTAGLRGVPSYCTSNPYALRSVFELARTGQGPILVEATCNQVNQYGGYTGLTPEEFRDYVRELAVDCRLDPARLVLGGDHLGPNPWKDRPADEALQEARTLVAGFAAAGYRKIHLDASMPCADDTDGISDETIAERAAVLCESAEAAVSGEPPAYVIGTEVPAPGGVTDTGHDALEVTRRADVARTLETHRQAFEVRGLTRAWERVAAIVVQPGVEFTNRSVIDFDPSGARDLAAALAGHDGLVYEAHSTDYQSGQALRDLVDHGFSFLKVGPALTFAFREAVVALSHMEAHLVAPGAASRAIDAVLAEMEAEPRYWQGHYTDPAEADYEKLFSYSDRIRYYWGREPVRDALAALFHNVEAARHRPPLLRQYVPDLDPTELAEANGSLAEAVIRARVETVMHKYEAACA